MQLRPQREARARAPGALAAEDAAAAESVLLQRNEINEQQRPGRAVMVPRMYRTVRGEKAPPAWCAKLLTKLTFAEGNELTGWAERLLFCDCAYVRDACLDPDGVVPAAFTSSTASRSSATGSTSPC